MTGSNRPSPRAAHRAAPRRLGGTGRLHWHGVHVGVSHDAQDRYVLACPYGERVMVST